MNFSEAIQFLYGLRLFGAKLGLENTRKLAGLAGNPQDGLRFIHVAGTNGKGSTCAMLEGIYRAAGLRVGLFTSPHLVSFRERIQVDRQLISEAEVVALVERTQARLGQFPREHHPTFFEVITVMALEFFAEKKCDLVVWETGLGGRLDATNIVTPLASVITNIALDHQQWLGETLAKIAGEKAGIIKAGAPAITNTEEPEALAVIAQTAKEKNAPLTVVSEKDLAAEFADALSLAGEHQRRNAALAVTTAGILRKQIRVSGLQIRAGLQRVEWPGRLQLICRGEKKFLLDGAHNLAGAQVLRRALEQNFAAQPKALVLGILEDKDWRHICETLAPLAQKIVTAPVRSGRTARAEDLAAACRAANPSATVSAADSLAGGLRETEGGNLTVITGSLYLVGEALELLGYFPPAKTEHELNEWGAKTG